MLKKLLALLLVLVLSAGFLVACTPENPGNTDTSSNSVLASSDSDKGNNATDSEKNTETETATKTETETKTEIKQTETNTDTNTDTDTNTQLPELKREFPELSVDDYFRPNIIQVEIIPSESHREFTIEDFADINGVEIKTQVVYKKRGHTVRGIVVILSGDPKESVIYAISVLKQRPEVLCASPVINPTTDASPPDVYFADGSQWGLTKINAPSAWDVSTGSNTIRIGLIDTGIDPNTPDLVGRINLDLCKVFTPDFTTPFGDVSGHGTQVASIIAARANNSGMVGVCWNIEIVVYRVGTGDVNSLGCEYLDYNGIVLAVEQAEIDEIDILNCSFGGFRTMTSDLQEAMSEFSGLIVCTAGNSNTDIDGNYYYPACYKLPNMISVGASTSTNTRWEQSSYFSSSYGDSTVDLFAPGKDILCSWYHNGSSSYIYATQSGTSFAAPFVSGVAGLIYAMRPDATPEQVKAYIVDNVVVSSFLSDYCITGGVLNAYNAVKAAHPHEYQYQQVSGRNHLKSCDCGLSTLELHNGYFESISASHHYVNCSSCGFSGNYYHIFRENEMTRYCTQCGYTIELMNVEPEHEVE